MLYQSMSGDADSGTSTFNCQSSTITIDSQSSVYDSAPMFFITNTDAMINLDSCSFTYGSNIFLKAGGTSKWGSTGSNGGVVTLNLKNQNVVGNFVVDEYSGLTINLENSSIQGTKKKKKTGAKVAINIDESSTINNVVLFISIDFFFLLSSISSTFFFSRLFSFSTLSKSS